MQRSAQEILAEAEALQAEVDRMTRQVASETLLPLWMRVALVGAAVAALTPLVLLVPISGLLALSDGIVMGVRLLTDSRAAGWLVYCWTTAYALAGHPAVTGTCGGVAAAAYAAEASGARFKQTVRELAVTSRPAAQGLGRRLGFWCAVITPLVLTYVHAVLVTATPMPYSTAITAWVDGGRWFMDDSDLGTFLGVLSGIVRTSYYFVAYMLGVPLCMLAGHVAGPLVAYWLGIHGPRTSMARAVPTLYKLLSVVLATAGYSLFREHNINLREFVPP